LYKLVNFVKDSIFDKYDVMLQEEIIFVGDFS
jgi:UDP-N-acetylenolpyruvoylglucosamine reductase